jgi:hypothetical protein
VASDKHQPQQIIADVIIQSCIEIRHRQLLRFHLASQFFVLAIEHLPAPQQIERAMLRRSHQPRARLFRNA